MKNIAVVGVGYVGLVTGACFASLGNKVVALDIDQARIADLKEGHIPIYEPGLSELVAQNVEAGRLHFTISYTEALKDAEFVFIAVGTPEADSGEADLQYVRKAAQTIAETMAHPMIIIDKSTVPVGTGDWVADIIREHQPTPIDFSVVSCPEFLREGAAISDFLNPDRTVLGSADREAAERVAQLHLALRAPIVVTDLRTAEMIKYASNAFLATRISFINEISNICELVGADVKEVAHGMGFDKRIGHAFLEAGVGYGGSCFPKDVKALAHMAQVHGKNSQLLQAVIDTNTYQRQLVLSKLQELLGDLKGKTIALLGLAFKQNTDDMREAPSITIADYCHEHGAIVRGYDPVAHETAPAVMPYLDIVPDVYDLAQDSDALVTLTPWDEFKLLDMPRIKQAMRTPVLIDGRNLYNPEEMRRLGFSYRGVGRGYAGHRPA